MQYSYIYRLAVRAYELERLGYKVRLRFVAVDYVEYGIPAFVLCIRRSELDFNVHASDFTRYVADKTPSE